MEVINDSWDNGCGRHRETGSGHEGVLLLEGDNQLKEKQSRLKWQDIMTNVMRKVSAFLW